MVRYVHLAPLFFRYKLFNWNRRATVGLVLDDGATDVAVAVAEAMLVVFALLADGDRVPADDGFVAFVVDIVANSLALRVYLFGVFFSFVNFVRGLFKRFVIAGGGETVRFTHSYMNLKCKKKHTT